MSVLSKIVPSTGYVAIFGFDQETKRGFRPEYLSASTELSQEYIDAAVDRLRGRGATDFYYSVASFAWPDGTPKSRAAVFASSFRSYIIDIDCHGKPGEYATPREAIIDGLGKLNSIGLAPNCVVFTGRGVQFIWSFTRDISPARWQEFGAEMWSVLMHLGIKADPACQGDRARIFRLPGTVNSKSGYEAKFLNDYPALSFKQVSADVSEYMLANGVRMIEPAQPDDGRDADEHGSVFDCIENEKMLHWLMDRIPAEFAKVDWNSVSIRTKDGYSVWRNIIWAIKRTGLANAWDVAEEWAMRASGTYDDIPESLRRTWDSDDDNKGITIGPGTLVAMANEFAPVRKRKGLRGFHFYSEEEVADLRAAGGYVSPEDRVEQQQPEPHDYCTEVHDDPEPQNDDEFWNCAEPPDDELDFPDPSDIECMFQPSTEVMDFIPELEQWAEEGGITFTGSARDDEEDDGRENGFDGPLEDMPPGEFGSPDFPLPRGYTFRKDQHGRISGLCVVLKRDAGDDEAGEELVTICSAPIELLEAAVIDRDTGPEFTYVFRWYDTTSGRPAKPFHVPAALLAAPAELAKVLSTTGGFLSAHPKAPSLMSIYLRALAEKRRAAFKDRKVYEQAGWSADFHEFVAGKVKIDRDGKLSSAALSKPALEAAGFFGETSGTEKAHAEVIDFYGSRPATGRAVLSMNLGSPLAALMPTAAAAVYVFSDKTSTGKSAVNRIGMGFYGNPVRAELVAKSTMNSIEETIIRRKDIQTFIDDFTIAGMQGAGKGGSAKTAEAMRDFVLHLSAQSGRRRMSTSGAFAGLNNMRWAAPTFMTSNAAPESFIGTRGHSTEAVYARLLSVPYDEMEGAFPPGLMTPDGESAARKMNENYGFIGIRFMKHVMLHQKEVRSWLEKKYAELSAASEAVGMAGMHRFYNTTIACGLYALKWMKEANIIPSWDEQETADYLKQLAFNNDEEARALASNDIDDLLEKFSTHAANSTIICGRNNDPHTIPDLNRMPRILLRVVGDQAIVNFHGFKEFCIANGVDSKRAMARIKEKYGLCARMPSPYNFTAGLGTTRQATAAFRMPASIFVEQGDVMPTAASPETGNVVRLPKTR